MKSVYYCHVESILLQIHEVVRHLGNIAGMSFQYFLNSEVSDDVRFSFITSAF